MSTAIQQNFTNLFVAYLGGDQAVLDQLSELFKVELPRAARQLLHKKHVRQTQPTAEESVNSHSSDQSNPADNTASTHIQEESVNFRSGDQTVYDQLIPLIEAELHRLAKQLLHKERDDYTLPTAEDLVNETYVRLIDANSVEWRDRAHFLSFAGHLMRRILVDHARRRGYQRQSVSARHVPFDEALTAVTEPDLDLLALDEALSKLAAIDLRASQVVELRFFGGLSVEETAEALAISQRKVKSHWSVAKLWLLRELTSEGPAEIASHAYKAEPAQLDSEFIAALRKRHSVLVDKKFSDSLSAEEEQELIQINIHLDNHEAAFYEPIERELSALYDRLLEQTGQTRQEKR